MNINSLRKKTSMLLSWALLLAVSAFAQNTGSLSGSVQDPNGGALADAKVTLSDPTKGFQLETKTNSEGVFSFSTVPPGTYAVTVEASGFKKTVKSGIVLSIADRQSTGVIKLEVGGLENTVEVTADAAQLLVKTESGEISQTINGDQVKNLAINGRNYLDLVKLTPGVISTVNAQTAGPGGFGNIYINGTRGIMHNLTIDGATNVDTGSNGTQHIALALDNIAEFKILSSAYQAEYGRSAGGDIKVLTKSGGKEFHGTGYYFHRHEQFNSNNYFNNSDAIQRNFYRYNYQGYNIGGPVWLPKIGSNYLKERLFFFFSQEFQEQLLPSASRQARVPTAAELAGDFRNTTDGQGRQIFINDPTKRDPVTGAPLACTDANTLQNPGGCFVSNNQLHVIPSGRFSPNGQAILGYFNQFANTPLTNSLFNHQSAASAGYPRREFNIRVDYNLSESTRMYVRYTRDADQQMLPYGLGWTGGANQLPIDVLNFKQAPAFNGTFNVTTTLSPTLTNEFVFGGSQNNLTLDPTDPNAATYSGFGFNWPTPFPYPASQFINITFSGINGIRNTGDNVSPGIGGTNGYSQFPYKNSNTTFDFYDNVSKVLGTHTAKAGIYVQRSRKDQAAGNSMAINFNNNGANPNNAGHPFANALLGNFDNLTQPTIGIYQGQYRSTNVEWYLQDNWKVNRKLTLDYGMRFNWIQPQYDQRLQGGFFNPSAYDPAQAVSLYQRSCKPGTFPCSGNDVMALNPITGGLEEAFKIGRVVPGSGDSFNGMQVPGVDIERGGFQNRGIQFGPAIGFAYDVFGDQKTVVRGGYRIGYDRVAGNNVIFPSVEQPPTFVNPRFDFGNIETVGVGAGTSLPALGTIGVRGADFGGHIPNVQSFSLQVQYDVGYDTVVSVGYVGTLSRHLSEDLNINSIPYGTLFTRAAQDPSRFADGVVPLRDDSIAQVYKDAGLAFDGSKALPADFLRRYAGYNTVRIKTFGGSSNYHSLQATVQRRFKAGLNLGAAYTWSKALGTSGAQDAETNWINPVCSRCYDYQPLSFDRTHNLVINYLWDLPKLKTDNFLVKSVVNNWQITGITTFQSGVPTELNFGINGVDVTQRVLGTFEEGTNAVRARLVGIGDLQSDASAGGTEGGSSFNFNNLRLQDINSGPLPRTFVRRPGINVTDLSIFKSFPLGGDGQRYIQLRLEMFNAFNHAQFDNINTGLTWNINNDFSNYRANQAGSAQTILNTRTATSGRLGRALGEFNGQPDFVSPNRRIQLAVKIYF
jgi:carboxypeptidase family protein/TonB-dependent receptor-like protein